MSDNHRHYFGRNLKEGCASCGVPLCKAPVMSGVRCMLQSGHEGPHHNPWLKEPVGVITEECLGEVRA